MSERSCGFSLFLALAGLSFSAPASAAGPGTSAATFLTLGYGSRPIGLGEAFVAVADDVSALHYNPAGLAFASLDSKGNDLGGYEMLVSHALLVQDIQMTQLGFLKRPYGVSVTHLSLGGIEQRTSESLDPEGTFGASDLALAFSCGRKFEGVGLGATARYVRETIGARSASAYALDLGALRRLSGLPVSLGLGVANLGTKVRFIDQAAPLPMTVRAGVSYGMSRSFPHVLSLQLDFPRDSNPVIRLGGEYLGFGPFSLRAGYRTYSGPQREAALGKALGTTASGLSEFYGMFMGAGFRSRLGNMDYSITPYGELGTAHRLTFSLKFGQAATPAVGVLR